MKPQIFLLILLQTFFLQGNRAIAQLSALEPGDRIRVTAPAYLHLPVVCTFEKSRNDSILFSMSGKKISLQLSQVSKIEIWQGKKRNTLPGFFIGAIPGALTLGLIFHSEEQNAEGFEKSGQPGAVGGAFLGGFAGGIIGGLVGHSISSDTWQEVYPKPASSPLR